MKDLIQKETGLEPFIEFIDSHRGRLEEALGNWLPLSSIFGTDRFNQALQYAVFPGGKRLRAYLTHVASLLGGVSDEQALKLSCAVEFIHTSSIILDDLPSMDDADLRRTRPALHLVFGEGIAVLVAVALLNQAYALFANSVQGVAPAERVKKLIKEATRCIGSVGMIAGQAAELLSSGVRTDDLVLYSRELKTTALMRLMMVAGGIVSGASDADLEALATYGECLGKAYQIYDDLADATGDRESTGKSVGQDSRHRRPSIIKGLDREESRKLATGIIEAGKDALIRFGDQKEADLLRSAAGYIVGCFNPATFSSEAAVQVARDQGTDAERSR
ncbi:MAG: geranylgeranyl diphosphate synthase, type [Blastocatellia bacterium]|nr:geranylgeranyl diphosphate synthase, type [Blastocatellia bacterium]